MAQKNNNGSSSNDRTTLEKDLATLLEYDDVSDEIPEIFDNLLQSFFPDTRAGTTTTNTNTNTNQQQRTTNCTNDLLEHMVAWLGDGGVAVQSFVENVVRFEGGESLCHDTSSSTTTTTNGNADAAAGVTNRNTQQSASQWNTNNNSNNNNNNNSNKKGKSNKQQQKERTNQKQKEAQQKKDELRRSQQQQEQKRTNEKQQQQRLEDDSRRKQKQREAEEQRLIDQQRTNEEQQRQTKELETIARTKQQSKLPKPTNQKPQPPPTGQATIICGCFGTKHKPLTNCLHCGRIACQTEGYGYCPSCTTLIQDNINIAATHQLEALGTPMEKAIRHKERLLQFDRECTKRTIVLDDQADYFKNSSSTWLSGEEREEAAEEDDTRRKDLHDRKKRVLKLDIRG